MGIPRLPSGWFLLAAIVSALVLTPLSASPTRAGNLAAPPVFSDSLHGTSLNPQVWQAKVGTGANGTIQPQADGVHLKLAADNTAADFGAAVSFLPAIRGDFDVSVDFRLVTWPSQSGARVGIDSASSGGVERASFSPLEFTHDERYATDFTGVGQGPGGFVATSDQQGRLRFTKTGATYAGYWWKGSDWVAINSFTSPAPKDTTDLRLQIWGNAINWGRKDVEVVLENFTITKGALALLLDVKGLTDKGNVSGTVPVEVTVTSGNARQAELLVDDKSRVTATVAPYKLPWDTTKETPGLHKVVVRVKDQDGNPTDRSFDVVVLAAAATAAASPAASPTAPATATSAAVAKTTAVVQATPTAVPTPTPPADNTLLYAGIGAGVLVALGLIALVLFLLLRRKPQLPPIPVEVSKLQRFSGEDTKAMFTPEANPPPATPLVVTPPPSTPSGFTPPSFTPPAFTPPVVTPSSVTPPSFTPPVVASSDGEKTALAGVADGGATVIHGPATPRGRLHIVNQGAERDVVVEAAETVIGREGTNPIVVKDPMASRKHAKIVIENGEFWVEDLKSLNGTKLNGQPLTTRIKLKDADQIKIGDAVLTFTAEKN